MEYFDTYLCLEDEKISKAWAAEYNSLVTDITSIVKTRYVDEKSNQMLCRIDTNDYSEQSFDSKMQLHLL